MVDDKRNGHWVLRYADGNVWEGRNEDGERNGHWIIRQADGTVLEGPVRERRAERTVGLALPKR